MSIELGRETQPAYLGPEDRERVELAQVAGQTLGRRLNPRGLGLRDCPVRVEFLRRPAPEDPVPPMTQMLNGDSGGRGGEVRLKLYLSLLWASPGGDHDTDFGAVDWAQLLGLPQYSTNGKRRIYQALQWLEDHQFVARHQRPGKPAVVTVLHESGTRTPYTKPSDGPESGGVPSYRRIQSTWWTNGWIAGLSGRALMFWMVLMDESGNESRQKEVWLSQSQKTQKYGISPYMSQRALHEQTHHGLIRTRRKMRSEAFGVKTSRTEISLSSQRLSRGIPSIGTGTGALVVPPIPASDYR